MVAELESPIPISAELAVVEGRVGSRNNSKSWTPRFLSPAATTPMKRVFVNLREYLEEIGHLTKLNPQDSWLPITESRSGNAHYAAFHTLTAGIGFQALLLPVAFSFLGWFVAKKHFTTRLFRLGFRVLGSLQGLGSRLLDHSLLLAALHALDPRSSPRGRPREEI